VEEKLTLVQKLKLKPLVSVLDLGSGTGQTDRQTARQTTAINALGPIL